MRRPILLAVLTSQLIWVGCKNKQVVAEEKQPTEVIAEVPVKKEPIGTPKETVMQVTDSREDNVPSSYSLVVSFYSIGSGIDYNKAQEYDNYLKDFQEQFGDYFSFDRVPWGREGELDYCIQFPTLNKEKAREFVNHTKDLLSNAQHVNVNENAQCKRRRKSP